MTESVNRLLQDTATGSTIPLAKMPFLIGISAQGKVVAGEPGETALAAITLNGGEAVVEALSRSHPVRVNGRQVEKMILLDGDALDVAGAAFVVLNVKPADAGYVEEDDDATVIQLPEDEANAAATPRAQAPGTRSKVDVLTQAEEQGRRGSRWLKLALLGCLVFAVIFFFKAQRSEQRVVEVVAKDRPAASESQPKPEPISEKLSVAWLTETLNLYRTGNAQEALSKLDRSPELHASVADTIPEWVDRLTYLRDLYGLGSMANEASNHIEADEAWNALITLEGEWLDEPHSKYVEDILAARLARVAVALPAPKAEKRNRRTRRARPVAATAREPSASKPSLVVIESADSANSDEVMESEGPASYARLASLCSGLPEIVSVEDRKTEAKCLYREAYRMEQANRNEARRLLAQVLRVAPAGSQYDLAARRKLERYGDLPQ